MGQKTKENAVPTIIRHGICQGFCKNQYLVFKFYPLWEEIFNHMISHLKSSGAEGIAQWLSIWLACVRPWVESPALLN